MSQPADSSVDQGELARLLEISRAFKASKTLNLAGKLGVFTLCARSPNGLTCDELSERLGFVREPGFRGAADFFDLLVALHTLARSEDGRYTVHPKAAPFLVQGAEHCITGILALNCDRSFPLFLFLEDGLKKGEVPAKANDLVPDICTTFATQAGGEDVAGGAEHFAAGMTGASLGNFRTLAANFDFSRYSTFVDMGGSAGTCSICVCQAHPHITATTCDLPAVCGVAEANISKHGLAGRIKAETHDFFDDNPFPKADCYHMSMILHDWGIDKKLRLMRKAFDALPPGGAFIAVEVLVDDERRRGAQGLAASLNMLVEFGKENAFDYSFAEFKEWAAQVGFSRCEKVALVGSAGACIAYK